MKEHKNKKTESGMRRKEGEFVFFKQLNKYKFRAEKKKIFFCKYLRVHVNKCFFLLFCFAKWDFVIVVLFISWLINLNNN